MTVTVRFVSADGGQVTEVEAAPGARLLDIGQAAGQPLEGSCEGQMACATCHVLVEPEDFGKLPPASEEEEDMLDFAAGARPNSRLACQIFLAQGWRSLTVRMPGAVRDMTGRRA
ncbi:MAG: 2Fe-2S iron-sulfur cluster-binding protein [Sphingomonadaceae bacterium]